jgi:heme/copper-type cytochrome/quinol oxidase subunit 3
VGLERKNKGRNWEKLYRYKLKTEEKWYWHFVDVVWLMS